jgi:sucrose-6-phosphate hydrolase SacC (GH32 family)
MNSPGELLLIDGWYYGTFHAYPSAGYEAGAGTIGFVRSRDLHNWVEVGSTLRAHDGQPWEQGGLYKSWLLHDNGQFYLYYNAKNLDVFGSTQVPPAWIEQTGMAMSKDLVTWTRCDMNPILSAGMPGDFDEVFASDPCVLRDGDDWIMFYFGLAADGHAREGFATSRDLIHWEKSGRVLLDVGPAGSIDSIHTHKPAVISRGGRLEHYYCAVAPVAGVDVAGYTQRELRGIARATSAPRRSTTGTVGSSEQNA